MSPKNLVWLPITVTVATAGTAVAISSTPINTPHFFFHVPNANSGANAYFGDSAVANTYIPFPKANVAAGITGIYEIRHGNGGLWGPGQALGFDLSQLFFDVDTSGDTIRVLYLQGE